jgi:hypothetical protein
MALVTGSSLSAPALTWTKSYKTDLESSLARAHCTLTGLFDGNLLFIELFLEQHNQSYIGATVGVAACHDADQGSSPHVVKNNKIIIFVP